MVLEMQRYKVPNAMYQPVRIRSICFSFVDVIVAIPAEIGPDLVYTVPPVMEVQPFVFG